MLIFFGCYFAPGISFSENILRSFSLQGIITPSDKTSQQKNDEQDEKNHDYRSQSGMEHCAPPCGMQVFPVWHTDSPLRLKDIPASPKKE
jgi:hypothetical protein